MSLPYFLIAGLFRGKYLSTARQRFGSIPLRSNVPSVWIHAVSVGELLAAKLLIKRILQEFPDVPLFISTTTISGQKLARDILPGSSFYFPFDWKWCVRKVFRRLQPALVLIMETEIWPNFLWQARQSSIPVVLINGRLSDRSFRRYLMVKRSLPHFDECLMQSSEDTRRMQMLGAPSVRIMGNLKFDFEPPVLSRELKQRLLEWKGSDLLCIAGSTMSGDEKMILEAFKILASRYSWKLILAPRHPERFREVEELVSDNNFHVALRSQDRYEGAQVLVLDTIGELAACYELADLVLIGGTWTPGSGGHNPIEPAYFGKAIITGPYYTNFRAIYDEFQRQDAIYISKDLAQAAHELLSDAERRNRMGAAGAQIVKENAGATEMVLQTMRRYWNAGKMVESSSQLSIR